MSMSIYQNNVNRNQSDIAELRKKMSSEIEKRSKLIGRINDISRSMKNTSSASMMSQRLSELSRKQSELASVEKKVAEYESKIAQKNKELARNQEYLDRETDRHQRVEEQKHKDRLTILKSINQELQKKTALEKKLGYTSVEVEDCLFVLKGDIKGYSRYMSDDFLSKYIPENFDVIVKKNALDCYYYNISGGDSLLILDKDIKKIIKAGKRIIEDLKELQTNPKIRIAIDYGKINYLVNEGLVTKIKTGISLRIAARLEPLVTPGEIWVTENVYQEIKEKDILVKDLNECGLDLDIADGKFNIKKRGSTEEDIYLKLYRIIH